MSATAMTIRDVVVRFAGVHAVDGVSLDIPHGITAIVGPNGAGKTSLFNAITGFVRATSGTVRMGDDEVSDPEPGALRRQGVSRTFQHLELFQELTVLENVLVGGHFTMRYGVLRAMFRTPRVVREERQAEADARALCATVGLTGLEHRRVSSLPYGTQKLVAIARALAGGPRILLLDEPASGLTDAEAERVVTLLRRLADDGLDIVLVEHNMRFVSAVASRVVALNFGTVLAEGTAAEVLTDPAVVTAYLKGTPGD